jgi:hypothetical protein
MAHAVASALCAGAAALGAAALFGCVSTAPSQTRAAAAPAPVLETPTASYDWHPLILVPFGTLLKDVPLALTEVLMFHDAAYAARPNEDKDCYSMQGESPPQFLGRRPDDYLLCFDHDRLSRIEASVRLPAADAALIFSAACAQWRRGAKSASDSPDNCEGRDGTTEFSAHLVPFDPAQTPAQSESAASDAGKSMATVSIELVDTAH